MSVEIQPNSPLGEALNMAIQGKIADLGWASGGAEGSAMSEYFILMLANGKSQDEIATEITNDLLGLAAEDESPRAFAAWLFDQINTLSAQFGSTSAEAADGQNAGESAQDETMDGGLDLDAMTDAPAEISAYVYPRELLDLELLTAHIL